jgi:hypothetical protein
MNYQGIRSKFEAPIKTAYAALSPAVPVFFDNFGDVTSDADSEFVYVNVQFGLTTEVGLTASLDNVRGILCINNRNKFSSYSNFLNLCCNSRYPINISGSTRMFKP